MTLIQFSTRILAGFSVANWASSRRHSARNLDDWEIVSQSRDFPVVASAQSRCFPITPHEIRSLLAPRRERSGAVLMRPIVYQSDRGPERLYGMALSRLRCSSEASLANAPLSLEAESIVFDSSAWARHAVCIVRNISTLRLDGHSSDGSALPAMAFDLPRMPEVRVRDCSPLSLAILDALACGRRAVFGLESFAEEGEFLLACANAVALLPRSLRPDISIAAGFTQAIPDALVQWIDGYVSPAQPGCLAADMLRLPEEARADEVSSRLFGIIAANEVSLRSINDQRIYEDVFQAHAKRRFASVLGRPSRLGNSAFPGSHSPSSVWRAVAEATSQQQRNISLELAKSAESLVDCAFGHAPRPEGMDLALPAVSSGGCIESLRTGTALAHSDPAAIADSICAIEETLALAKVVAGTLRWTPGLTTMTRRAIGALRKVVISKPDADFCTNASFLRALEQAPHCARIVAALIEADDRSVRRGVEQAVAAISSAVGLKKIHGWATSNMLGKDRSEENFGFVVCGKRVGFRQVGMPPLRSANDVSAPRISSS